MSTVNTFRLVKEMVEAGDGPEAGEVDVAYEYWNKMCEGIRYAVYIKGQVNTLTPGPAVGSFKVIYHHDRWTERGNELLASFEANESWIKAMKGDGTSGS